MKTCYCGSGNTFADCCEPYILGNEKPATAEQLMRSRYSAFAIHAAPYLWKTTAASERKYHSEAAILDWAKSNQWVKLDVLFTNYDTVEFKACYLDAALQPQIHHERSKFIRKNGSWFYKDGVFL